MNRKKILPMLTAISLSSLVALSGCASLSTPKNSSTEHVNSGVTQQENAMMQHLQAFQKIAEQHHGNRAVGTAGGLASAQYILDQAKKAGFHAQMLPFENREKTVGQNIVVEIEGQSKDSAVIVGAHYDSVKMGPGINDNGSGVALVLQLMQTLAAQKEKPKHTVYLAFWDSEEVGIAGSRAFAEKLSAEQLKGIKAYINVDMVGTKNPTVMIADASKSSVDEMEKMLKERGLDGADYQQLLAGMRAIPSHAGDLALEQTLMAFLKQKGIVAKKDISTLTASDTAPFLGKVPVASIILFNEQLKDDVLEFAPCYHQACDTLDQVDPKSLTLASEMVWHLLSSIDE